MTTALVSLAGEIQVAHEAACRAAESALAHARRAGELLIEAKAAQPHGAWLPWLSKHCSTISDRTARRYMQVATRWPELEAVVGDRTRVSDLPIRQAVALLLAEPSEITQAANTIYAERRETRRQARVEQIRVVAEAAPLVTGRRYPVILADPPWRYEHTPTDSRAIENHYPTMVLDDICALPIADVRAPTAVIFLWATSPKLYEAMRVLDSWGFTYRTCMIWVKPSIGMGYYARQRHELLLIATAGTMVRPAPATLSDSVIEAPRGRHSEKPVIVHEIIERMYPELPRIELFARARRDGWAAWGGELEATGS